MKYALVILVVILLSLTSNCQTIDELLGYQSEINKVDWNQWGCQNLSTPLKECVNLAVDYVNQIAGMGILQKLMENATFDHFPDLESSVTEKVCPMVGNLYKCLRSKIITCPVLYNTIKNDSNYGKGEGIFKKLCYHNIPGEIEEMFDFEVEVPSIGLDDAKGFIDELYNVKWTDLGCQNMTTPLQECANLVRYYIPQLEGIDLNFTNSTVTMKQIKQLDPNLFKLACPMVRKALKCTMDKLSQCQVLYKNLTRTYYYKFGRQIYDDVCPKYPDNACEINMGSKQLKVCGGFGDPHFQLFNGSYSSYQHVGQMTILDNKHLKIVVDTQSVSASQNIKASAISALNITYKDVCDQAQLSFKPNNFPDSQTFAKNASFIIYVNQTVYFPRIFTKIFITQVRNFLQFSLVTPLTNDPGVCRDGLNAPVARLLVGAATYPECDGIVEASLKAACNFDIGSTNDNTWAQSTTSFVGLQAEATTEASTLAEQLSTTQQFETYGQKLAFALSVALALLVLL